jgi:hypothetical protein
VPDPTLSRGQCSMDGQENTMIVDLTAQVQQIREDLLRRVQDARS